MGRVLMSRKIVDLNLTDRTYWLGWKQTYIPQMFLRT